MPTDPFFQMTVEDVFSIRGRGTVVTGRIEQGTLQVGNEIQIKGQAGTKNTVVSGIEMFRKRSDQANAGDTVGLLLRDIGKDEVRRGDLLTAAGPDFSWNQ
jgi:elongation factor Tu